MESTGILVIGCCPKLNEYPSTTIPTPPCHTVRLADFLSDKEIAWACNGYIVAGVEGNYSELLRLHLQGCLVGRTVLFFPSKVKLMFSTN